MTLPPVVAAACVILAACASVEFQPDTSWDSGWDSGYDTGHDTGLDTGGDTAIDTGYDTGLDTGWDTGVDTGWDTGFDTGVDTGYDTGWDTGVDTGYDTGSDTGVDTWTDPDVDPDAPPSCPDGIVNGTEECDDGNADPLDGCSPTCTWEYCGDGLTGVIFGETFGFETGDLGDWSWTPGTDYDFSVTSARAHTGTYSIVSTNGGVTYSYSNITLSAYTQGSICFWFMGQSESCCDDFGFYVDGYLANSWAGDHTAWTQYCHTTTPGTHSFEWEYYKDSSIDTGLDAYWIDDITILVPRTEVCDDGGTVSGDGCSADCLSDETCGNSYVDVAVGEECDDGGIAPGDGCTPGCMFPTCGDSDLGWSMPFDGFETGDLTQLPWTTGTGDGEWRSVNSPANARTGQRLLVSQNSGSASTTAWVQVPLATAAEGDICFWYRGESESCCDFFYFILDGTTVVTASGTVGTWTQSCTRLAAGSHTFRWEYEKDYSVDTGQDRFSIDDVTFPMIAEACDDGGTVPGDGCSSNCLAE